MLEPLINLLIIVLYIVVIVGLAWAIFWAIDNLGEAFPPKVKLVAKAVVGIVGLILLLQYFGGNFPRLK